MMRLCGAFVCVLCLYFPDRAIAQFGPGTIVTIAGTRDQGFSGDGGAAINADLDSPSDVAVDAKGNVYIADTGNGRIRRVGTNKIISTLLAKGLSAGGTFFVDVWSPQSIAVDAQGTLYIADSFNHLMLRLTSKGDVTTFAGGGNSILDGRPASRANFGLAGPIGVAVDTIGNVYVADTWYHRVRRVGIGGIITTIAGWPEEPYEGPDKGYFAGDGKPATQAGLNWPSGVAVDAQGNVYIADTWNHRIRRVGKDGIITTIAGSGPIGKENGSFSGDGGPATKARLNIPFDVAVDAKGNVYIADSGNNCIRQVGTDGTITTFAGTGTAGFSSDGRPANQSRLNHPTGVAVDAEGNVYIADTDNHLIRRVNAVSGGGTSLTPPTLSTASLTFDNTNVGETSQKTFTISNTGTASLSVTGITISGTDASQFKASPTSATIAAGQSATVTVTFVPTSGGSKSATLSVVHSATGSPLTITLSGTAVSPTTSNPNPTAAVTFTADLDPTAGDQSQLTRAAKSGDEIKIEVYGKKITNAQGAAITIQFDPTQVQFVNFTSSISGFISLPGQVKENVVIFGGAVLGSTFSGEVVLLSTVSFKALPTFREVRFTITEIGITFPGGVRNTFNPNIVLKVTGSTPSPDFNGDGKIDFDDFFLFASAFGQKATGDNAKFDLDGDGVVGFGDFFIFADAFGKKR